MTGGRKVPMPTASPGSATDDPRTSTARPYLMLGLATAGFAVNFWAWALLSPLGTRYKEVLALSASQQGLLVAVPVVVGSLGRIPVGALTDRFGGRVMFPLISAATIVPVLFLGTVGQQSLTTLLVGGFFLGIGGTSFAVGVPFVNGWFPPARRGLAVGVFGAGMGGTAVSALTTVRLLSSGGSAAPFLITAVALAVYAVVAWVVLRDPPGRVLPTSSLRARLRSTARLPITWQGCIFYGVAFGGYVAFSVYLPAYLKTAYGLQQADAANRMAGFVLLAVLMRPFGGWLSDRIGAKPILAVGYGLVTVCAAVQATTPALMPVGTIAFLVMAAALGAGSGATFALIARVAPSGQVGSVTGLVGAAGGLGGFIPPLIMGAVYGRTGSYAIGLVALAIVAAATLALTMTVVRSAAPVRDV